MTRCAKTGYADSLLSNVANRLNFRLGPTVDSQNWQRRCNRDQITPCETARDDSASPRIANGKFASENRGINQRQTAQKYAGNLEDIFLKNFFFHNYEKRKQCTTKRVLSNRK